MGGLGDSKGQKWTIKELGEAEPGFSEKNYVTLLAVWPNPCHPGEMDISNSAGL